MANGSVTGSSRRPERGQPSKAARLLLEELERSKRSQNDLARDLGVHSGVVSRWLTGVRRPELEKMLLVEELFGIEPKLWLEV